MATRVVTVDDILDGHVGLDLECFDRIYLNGWVPNLQVSGQVVGFLTSHLGFPIPSPAILEKIGQRFRRAVDDYTAANDIPVIRFAKGERKLKVMRPHLDRLAREGRCGVAAIGVAQVEQVGDGEEHRFLHARVGVSLDEQVHRPIRLILVHSVQAGDRDVVAGPVGRGELRGRVDGSVRDQCEQHPLHVGGEPATAQDLPQCGVNLQSRPQPVQQPRRPGRPGGDQPQPVGRGAGAGGLGSVGAAVRAAVGLAEVAVDRAHQPAQPVRVEPVLAAQVE